jgi:hypothetical protein
MVHLRGDFSVFNKKEKRFITKDDQGDIRIVVDSVTGVNYIVTLDGIGSGISGITPLLDKNGNVVIDI